MSDFLSDEWIAELDAAARADEQLQQSSQGATLTLEQRVTDSPQGDRVWHVNIDDGTIRIQPGAADNPDVTFTQGFDTAVAVATAELSAQAAFMLGRLRIGGTVGKLIEHRSIFDGLDDIFAGVRATTTY